MILDIVLGSGFRFCMPRLQTVWLLAYVIMPDGSIFTCQGAAYLAGFQRGCVGFHLGFVASNTRLLGFRAKLGRKPLNARRTLRNT